MANIFIDFKDRKVHIGNKSPGDSFENCGEITGFNSSSIIKPEYTVKSNSNLTQQQIQRCLSNFKDNWHSFITTDYNINTYKKWMKQKMSVKVDTANNETFVETWELSKNVVYDSVLGTLKKSKATDFVDKFTKLCIKANLTNSYENYEKLFLKLLQTYKI